MSRLRRMGWDLGRWRATRHCDHQPELICQRSRLVDLGRRKMFWCLRCQRTWF
jgi:hypothetical protein